MVSRSEFVGFNNFRAAGEAAARCKIRFSMQFFGAPWQAHGLRNNFARNMNQAVRHQSGAKEKFRRSSRKNPALARIMWTLPQADEYKLPTARASAASAKG